MLLDLDDFKEVNDTSRTPPTAISCSRRSGAGYCEVAPAGGTVARLGGDEFAVLIPFLEDPKAVTKRCQADQPTPSSATSS